MMQRFVFVFALLAFAGLFGSGVAASTSSTLITPYSAFQGWLPIVFLGILVSIMITAFYYVLGVLLDNKNVKSRAVGEFAQATGTAMLVVIILGVFALMGTGQLSFVSLLSQSSLGTVCGQLYSSPLTLLANQQPSGVPTATNTICESATGSLGDPVTNSVDYGLYAAYIVMDNLTTQAANNMNAMYLTEGWLGFLANFNAYVQVCAPQDTCIVPLAPRVFNIQTQYTPLAGYTSLTTLLNPVETESVLTFYILFIQMLVITIFLYAWPFILAAGILLRSTFFTRKLGGLLVAITLAMVVVLPLTYLLEYTAFTNLNLGPIGASSIPNQELYEQNGASVAVYGMPSQGYVPASAAGATGCAPSDYVYSTTCTAPYSIGSSPACVPFSQAQTRLCLQGGYVSATTTQNLHSSCVGSSHGSVGYVYETQCGVPDTAGQQCSSDPSPSSLCPTSGYVLSSSLSTNLCDPSTPYIYETTCGDSSSIVSSSCTANPVNSGTGQVNLCVAPLDANINFFVLPNVGQVTGYYGCNVGGDLLANELEFASWYLTPLNAYYALSLAGGLIGSLPQTPLNGFIPNTCTPTNALNAVFALANSYGIVFVSSIFTLIFNALIAIAAVSGLATLMGGDTSILGMGRLI